VKSLIEKLGTKEFARVRVGIGHPVDRTPVEDYVLQKFRAEDAELAEDTKPKPPCGHDGTQRRPPRRDEQVQLLSVKNPPSGGFWFDTQFTPWPLGTRRRWRSIRNFLELVELPDHLADGLESSKRIGLVKGIRRK